MATLTIADLDNGKRDLQTVDEVANSRAATATTRFGQQTTTLYESIRRINATGDEILSNLGFRVPVPYASGLNVTDSRFTVTGPDGKVYAPLSAPFTTGTWNPAQWYVLQNDFNDHKLLVFDTLVEAEAAATVLPDGQKINTDGFQYSVVGGALSQKTPIARLVAAAYGGTVQDALLFITPQMHTSTAGSGSDDSAALQWAFDSGLPVQLGGFSYKANQLLTSTDKTISINGNDARILCTAAGGVDIKLRPGEDYFYGAGFRVIADGALSGDGLHVWSATSVAHGSPSVQINNVYVSRSDVANGFNRAFFLENVFQTTLNNLHIRGSTFGAVFDSCVSVAMWNPDIVFSDTGFKTLATNRGCEGFRLNGGFIYNNRVSMDVFRVLDIQLQGTHLLGREKILRIERSFQSSFSGAVWYCDTFDGTERDLISSHDTVQSVRFTDITVELVGPALGHHNAFVANSGFIQNSITACRFRNLTLNSGANDNVVTSVILEKTGGVTNLTDNGLRNKKIGIFSDGVSSLDFSYSGTTQLRLSPNLVTVETPMTVKSVTEFYNVLDLHQSDATTVTDYDARISISNATGVNAGGMITLAAVNIRPATDGGMDVGQASRRFGTYFGVTGAINTSDGRYKTEPYSIPDAWLDAVGEAGPELWKWLDSVALKGELARTHCGPIAQHLVDAFVRHGVMEEGSTDSPFGGLCYDEWEDEYEPVMGTRQVEYADTDGNLVLVDEKYDTGEKRLVTKAGNRWSIRPDQCLWLRMAWMDREQDRLRIRIEQMEKAK